MNEQILPVAPQPVRPWTPDQLVWADDGGVGRRLSVKRACSCGEKIGDVTDNELVSVANVRNRRIALLPVTDECWRHRGFHAVFANPEVRQPRWTESDGDTWTIELLCPGKRPGELAMSCASWQQCGCVTRAEPLTVEFEAFLAQACPASPTGEHRYITERGYVGAPTGPCVYQACENIAAAAEGWLARPGIYPVNVELEPTDPMVFEPTPRADRLVFEPVSLRQRDAMPAVG